jgi:PIN domain nuclease of toxin-antitoxin system
MRPFLLDTCAVIWVASGEISRATAEALAQARRAGIPLYVSPITAWEIGMLASKGRFRSSLAPLRWFEQVVNTPGVALADISPAILIDSSFLPGAPPRDPADRIIAATARECGFTVMTRDRALLDYAGEGHVSAAAC